MTPKPPTAEPTTVIQELNVSEGIESIQELDWENAHTEQGFGNSNI